MVIYLCGLRAACADEARAKNALVPLNAPLCVLIAIKEEAEVLLPWSISDHLRTRLTPVIGQSP